VGTYQAANHQDHKTTGLASQDNDLFWLKRVLDCIGCDIEKHLIVEIGQE
jgi:hypothetical protein